MNKYVAFFKGRESVIEAETLFMAKQQAILLFRVRRSQEHMVHVHLAELDGQSVIHIAVD